MDFDLAQLADRLRTAADRTGGLKVTISGMDLILSRDGYGTHRSETVTFASLFLRPDDVLAQALDRLGAPMSGDKPHAV